MQTTVEEIRVSVNRYDKRLLDGQIEDYLVKYLQAQARNGSSS